MCEWTFAIDRSRDIKDYMVLEPNIVDKIMNGVNNSTEAKRQRYEQMLNNMLDTIMLLETAARADGFDVKLFTRVDNGKPIIKDDGSCHIITSYGVHVVKK